MKIALVSSGSGSKGGGELYLLFLANALVAEGHRVIILVPKGELMDPLVQQLCANPAIDVRRFDYRSTYDRRFRNLGAALAHKEQARLAHMFAQLPVDILHINQQVMEDCIDLALAARKSGKPWLSTVHIGHSAKALGAKLGRMRDFCSHYVMGKAGTDIIAVSEASAGQIGSRVKAQVHCVHNGVPVPSWQALQSARQQARKDWGATEDDIVVGALGRIEAQKNPLALVDRLAPFARQGRRIRLVWIGDGAMHEDLRRRAETHGGSMPLIIDGWREDAATRISGFDIFMLPSLFEGLPLAILEAMHAGLPIVASMADGIAEAIENSRTGFLCESDAQWTDAIGLLIEDEDARSAVAKAAKESAALRFSDNAMARATAAVYDEVLLRHCKNSA